MDDATRELILRNLWPMLRATVLVTIPLTAVSFVLGLVLALLVALARISGSPRCPCWPGGTSR
jgi:cystine transport system permease protein